MRPRIITEAFTAQAKALSAEGMTLTEIGAVLGCSRQTVSAATGGAQQGGKHRKHKPHKLTPQQEKEVLMLVGVGVTRKACATMYGVERRTIYRAIARAA